jgi:hypothetical protein
MLANGSKLKAFVRRSAPGIRRRCSILMAALSHQGISDRVADDYMARHGQASWHVIDSDLRRGPSCPKLKSYWHFHGCRYNKSRYTCAEPDHLPRCPLPNHWLRNGRLNETAFSLYLFIRDIANGDLVGWIDGRLETAAKETGPNRLPRMRMALLDPLREIYGIYILDSLASRQDDPAIREGHNEQRTKAAIKSASSTTAIKSAAASAAPTAAECSLQEKCRPATKKVSAPSGTAQRAIRRPHVR